MDRLRSPSLSPLCPATLVALAAIGLCFVTTGQCAEETALKAKAVDVEHFEKRVRPLLVKHCYECHSADAKELKGGLGLDTRNGWQVGGDSGPAIVPGKPGESLFLDAVRYDSFEMPPKGKLPDHEIAVFEEWIKRGAVDPRTGPAVTRPEKPNIDFAAAREFWAFQLPEPHRAPVVKDTTWPRDDLDRFVLARLEAAGLQPAADTDRETWLRRVTFDLTGLPPTPEQLTEFLADNSGTARETVVDRLLASPQFGVRWGRHWLDVARYADSNGSDFNATFYNAWRYRNYVIDAFNNDKPFDQFVREQIAGDLLPADSPQQEADQIIATTFLMVGPKMLSERDKDKLTMDVVDEQIDSVGRAFLGMTLGCARCHDHKFDPIPTADYYALAGIFRSTVTLEGESQQYVSTWVETPLPISDEHATALKQHKSATDAANNQLSAARKALKSAEKQLASLQHPQPGVLLDDKAAVKVGDWKESKLSPNFVGSGYLHDDRANKGKKSITWTPDLPTAGEYEVRVSYTGGNGRDSRVPVTIQHADGTTELKIDQVKRPPIDNTFLSLGKFRFPAGRQSFVRISTKGTTGFVIADAVHFLPTRKQQTPAVAESARLNRLRERVAGHTAAIKSLEADLKRLKDTAPPPAPTAMAAREAKRIEDCSIHIRGEVHNRGPAVKRGFLQVASEDRSQVTNPQHSGRRELAEWITRDNHPLTARVIVNRVWHHLLGAGLVRSVDNFGHLGERPSHPDLLDTLAADFVGNSADPALTSAARQPWSIKRLVRRIVLSRTYAQATRHDDTAFETDPDNRLLWRAHRKPLTAESLRDALLQISQQLDLSPGESPVKGAGKLAIDNSSQNADTGVKGTSKRSVYLPIVRNSLPAILTVFDFADPDVVTGRRAATNVPAQALFLLNDPFVKTAAVKTTDRVLATGIDTNQRITQLYLLVLNRKPTPAERERATAFLTQNGESAAIDKTAWTQFVQALFASTEFRLLD